MDMTRADLVTITQTCADWAPNYFRIPGGKDAAIRYIADGHLDGLTLKYGRSEVWRAVAAHLDAHPHQLTAPRTTQAERDNRQADRNARAETHLTAALHHHKEAQPYEALALIDRAELTSPTYKDFDRYRRAVRMLFAPLPPTDLTGTGLRHRVTLPMAYPHPGPPVMHHGSTARRWVYPGHRVIEGNWPAAIPEHCHASDDELMEWNADGTVQVCTGCGLDYT
ncbi:hypothetical protein AB0D32_16190 [Micromonospora sp. NPDC048170]|uniref:hypothetical protein n=1 Tax=Micromonospora sp. NPDC048170 TaxID=3154819 RepID=UPI0033C4E45C